MPFKKVGNDDYTSPSGRHFDSAQVRLYYAHGGHFPGQEGHSEGGTVNKGYMAKTQAYAAGGPVLGRSADFMKQPDRFRGNLQPNPKVEPTQDDFGKGGKSKAPTGKDKSEKPVLPRK